MTEFLTKYFVEIVLSVVSIVIGAIVGYVFYRLQKRDVASAEVERIKQARAEILDILENNIINKQKISEEAIHNLLAASEREHNISLRNLCTPVTLLQDVALRLHRSRHLDIAQKTEYATYIGETILMIAESNKVISAEAKHPIELAKSIESAIQSNQPDKALENLSLLKTELNELTATKKEPYISNNERWQLLASIIAALGTMIALFSVIADLPAYKEAIVTNLSSSIIGLLVTTALLALVAIFGKGFLRKLVVFDGDKDKPS